MRETPGKGGAYSVKIDGKDTVVTVNVVRDSAGNDRLRIMKTGLPAELQEELISTAAWLIA